MIRILSTTAALLITILVADTAVAQNARWHQMVNTAQKEAQETGKPILMYFTGSDWCPYCINMRRNVFVQPAFREWAKEKVVLLEVDFPRNKRQAPAVKGQNDELKRRYNVTGYPTVVFTDGQGKQVGRIGYGGQNAEAWTNMANGIVERAMEAQRIAQAEAEAKMAKRYDDYNAALSAAREQNRLILAVFVGKDWSIPSKALEEKVLRDDAFQEWAKENVILLELDYPRGNELDEAVKAEREKIQDQYKVARLPTALLLDLEGKELVRQEVIRPTTKVDEWLTPIKKGVAENAPPPRETPVTTEASGDDASAAADNPDDDI